jgi:hypothetical protein
MHERIVPLFHSDIALWLDRPTMRATIDKIIAKKMLPMVTPMVCESGDT